MPKLAFPIARTGFYRTLGPIIEAALEDSYWEVELLLGPPVHSDDLKAYHNPTLANIPTRLKGRCKAVIVSTLEEMIAHLNRADVVISVVGRSVVLNGFSGRVQTPLWCTVFDADHSVVPAHRFDEAELNFWPSRYYLDWAVEAGAGTREHMEARSHEIGYVRADPLKLFSPEATRQEWGIDLNRPVVLYIPDGYRLRRDPAYVTDWYRHVWCVDNRLERLARALIFRRHWQGVRQALNEKGSHVKMIRALRRFCDRHKAQLVMMPRPPKAWYRSRGFTAEELDAADCLIAEREQYPQTLVRAAQMADLIVCSYPSGALLDGVAAGVPYITVGLPSIANSPANEAYAQRFNREQDHWPGATWLISAENFVSSFANESLTDFKIDPAVLEQVRAQYVGPVDGQCSQRLLDVVRKHLDGHTPF